MRQKKLRLTAFRAVICIVILLVVEISCSDFRCDSPEIPFSVDMEFTENDLEGYLMLVDFGREDVECDRFCDYWVPEAISSLSSCELMIEPVPGNDPDDIAGTIECSVDVFEHRCY